VAVIAIVDDDESVRLATADLLSSSGFLCETFDSATAYLASGRVAATRCLILDLSMPGMDGLALQRELTRSGHTIPIIFITAFAESRTRAQALEAGALCYLPKPYADEELLDCIRRALEDDMGGTT